MNAHLYNCLLQLSCELFIYLHATGQKSTDDDDMHMSILLAVAIMIRLPMIIVALKLRAMLIWSAKTHFRTNSTTARHRRGFGKI